MHPATVRSLRTTALILAGALALPPVAAAAPTQPGYTYTLHHAGPPPEAFDDDPATFRHSSAQAVAQGPDYTLIWNPKADQRTAENASFARGERRMGLFVPHWDLSRPASRADGWTHYGKALTYDAFDVTLERGDDDRTIADLPAKHYVLAADWIKREGGNDVAQHITLDSDVWVVEGMPFSWAPFATAGIFGDPRLDAAMSERLSKLGMVVRAATTYTRRNEDRDGNVLGYPHEGSKLSWVTDLKPAQVPVVSLPHADGDTVDALRAASRKDPEGTCKAALNGEAPAFVARLLDGGQRNAFLAELKARCRQRAQREG